MTIEADLFATLKVLVGNRVFPDMAPLSTIKPYLTYSQVGGEAISFIENTLPDLKNGRFQVNVWGDTRAACSALMLQVEASLIGSATFSARPVSAPQSGYDYDMEVYSSMQDFTIWSTR